MLNKISNSRISPEQLHAMYEPKMEKKDEDWARAAHAPTAPPHRPFADHLQPNVLLATQYV